MASAPLQALMMAETMESAIDGNIKDLDSMGDDEFNAIRRRRLAAMKAKASQRAKGKANGPPPPRSVLLYYSPL